MARADANFDTYLREIQRHALLTNTCKALLVNTLVPAPADYRFAAIGDTYLPASRSKSSYNAGWIMAFSRPASRAFF